MLSNIKTISLQGLDGIIINIEVDTTEGIPYWDIVGLPDTSIREARERVKSAIKNSGFEFLNRRYIINLSPADIRKEGAILDLPIAVGVLASIGVLSSMTALELTTGFDGAEHSIDKQIDIENKAKDIFEKNENTLIVAKKMIAYE